MSARETHVTEYGLGLCAGLSDSEAMLDAGLHPSTVACTGIGMAPQWATGQVIFGGHAPNTVPTCPRCAVMRDEALEGRLPKRKENES